MARVKDREAGQHFREIDMLRMMMMIGKVDVMNLGLL